MITGKTVGPYVVALLLASLLAGCGGVGSGDVAAVGTGAASVVIDGTSYELPFILACQPATGEARMITVQATAKRDDPADGMLTIFGSDREATIRFMDSAGTVFDSNGPVSFDGKVLDFTGTFVTWRDGQNVQVSGVIHVKC